MKILEVNPGNVANDGGGWTYTILYRTAQGWAPQWVNDPQKSAAAAKQAMREKVRHERKRHGLEK